MTPTDADALAKRIINTWHGGPRLDEWTDAIGDLHAGTAGTTFVRLRSDLEHAPSIARFLATYRSLHTATTDPVEHSTCQTCDGTSWVAAPDLVTADGRRYTQVDRCPHCAAGRPVIRAEPLLAASDPRAQAAFARGYAEGIAELDAMRPRPKETP